MRRSRVNALIASRWCRSQPCSPPSGAGPPVRTLQLATYSLHRPLPLSHPRIRSLVRCMRRLFCCSAAAGDNACTSTRANKVHTYSCGIELRDDFPNGPWNFSVSRVVCSLMSRFHPVIARFSALVVFHEPLPCLLLSAFITPPRDMSCFSSLSFSAKFPFVSLHLKHSFSPLSLSRFDRSTSRTGAFASPSLGPLPCTLFP